MPQQASYYLPRWCVGAANRLRLCMSSQQHSPPCAHTGMFSKTSMEWAAPVCSKPAPGSLLVQLGRQQVVRSGVRGILVLLAGPQLLVQLGHCSLWGESGWQQVCALCT